MSRTGTDLGFSLLEILVATVILSIGVVFLFPSFFLSADALAIARDRLALQTWAQERLWEDGQVLRRMGRGAVAADAGEVRLGPKTYAWEEAVEEKDPGLFVLTLRAGWKAAGRPQEETYVAWIDVPE
jgi:prepilin-type N-terminal cleavage/methylation domain-containing protein